MPIGRTPYTNRSTSPSTPNPRFAQVNCPECSGLECLCRPRFFPGQLLTDEDLKRLDRYIVEKNKLHNRSLFGWGVVYGLEVVCHPCADEVIVRPGYAISPCGEDIIVSEETVVSVCELINACKEEERRQWECEPYPYSSGDNRKDQCQEWVLSVRYDEKPSRGVVPLRQSQTACCSRCSGGNAASCGCNCHKKGNGTGNNGSSTKQTPQQCEPTAICEGFKFEVSRVRPEDGVNLQTNYSEGPMAKRSLSAAGFASSYQGSVLQDPLRACLLDLEASLPSPPAGSPPNPEQLYAWCCDTKEALTRFFQSHPTYDCRLDEKLASIICPLPPQKSADLKGYMRAVAEYQKAVMGVRSEMLRVAKAYLDYCKCSTLLPPCPDPGEDPRVPLAVITICGDGCQLMQVCNLGARRYVLTFPLLEHYLDKAGLGQLFQKEIQAFCCPPEQAKPIEPSIGGFGVRPRSYTVYASTPEARAANFSRILADAIARPDRIVSTFSILAGAMGAVDEEGRPLSTNLELENPLQALLVNSVVAPVLKNLIPPEAEEIVRPFAARVAEATARAEESTSATVTRMQNELEALRKTVADQQASIASLLEQLKQMHD